METDREKVLFDIVKNDFQGNGTEVVTTVRGISLANQQVDRVTRLLTDDEKARGIEVYHAERARPSDKIPETKQTTQQESSEAAAMTATKITLVSVRRGQNR